MDEEVRRLILELGDEDSTVRWNAAFALGKIAEEHPEYDWSGAVPALIKAVGDGDSTTTKWYAAWALGTIARKHPEYYESSVVPALIEALRDEDSNRLNAAAELGKIGLPAVPALILALKDGNSGVRKDAAWALGAIAERHPEYEWSLAVPALILALGDGNSAVGKNAAEALGKIGPEDYKELNALIPIARKLKSENKDFEPVMKLYSKWVKVLSEKVDRGFADKKFHVPEVKKPDKTKRVLRVKRVGA